MHQLMSGWVHKQFNCICQFIERAQLWTVGEARVPAESAEVILKRFNLVIHNVFVPRVILSDSPSLAILDHLGSVCAPPATSLLCGHALPLIRLQTQLHSVSVADLYSVWRCGDSQVVQEL